MGWDDRKYNEPINYGGNPFRHPLLKLLFGSVYIGTLFRARIRIHASLLWYIGISVAVAGPRWQDALISAGALFLIVFLHEFGHCFACRAVGGDADEIMLWILGGLAFARAPRRPWPQFVTIAGGPLVNVILAVILGVTVWFGYHVIPPLNPLMTFDPSLLVKYYLGSQNAIAQMCASHVGRMLFWLCMTNWTILFFNLLPFFPLDGGQMLQAILWKPLGYVKAMRICCYLGMAGGAVMLILFGLAPGVLFIAAFCFISSLQMLRMLQMGHMMDEAPEPYDLSAAWEHPDHPVAGRGGTRKKTRKRRFRAARKRASQEQAEQAKIDAILAKVKEKGLHSLTWGEKRTLKKATERQRQRDLAERI